MNDWIDRMAENYEPKDKRLQREKDIRLHDASVIKSKAPQFWDSLIERLKSDSARLSEKFSDNTARQCSVTNFAGHWEIRGRKMPARILRMRLDPEGQIVYIDVVEQADRGKENAVGSEQIKITVNGDEELEWVFSGQRYSSASELSRALISEVISQ
jgi:ribosomal protein RSM22 (predicted rRNA methylase)